MVKIHTPTKQTFRQFDMHAEFNTFRNQVTSMQIFHFNNSDIKLVPALYLFKILLFYEVNKEELLIHILQGASNTDGMHPMRQTALQVYVILMWHVDMFSG